MGRKRSSGSKGSTRSDTSWKDKVHRVDFTGQMRSEAIEWIKSSDVDPFTALEEIVDNGWSIRITPQGDHNDYWVSVTDRGSSGDTGGHTFSVTYPDVRGGVILAFYLHKTFLITDRLSEILKPEPEDWMGLT